ncbi:MAG TPA: hypothetical protein VLT15_04505 [Acidimicrobiia bacterium]|nr:hypothetical protein [Acidimicrobiia bacterium]
MTPFVIAALLLSSCASGASSGNDSEDLSVADDPMIKSVDDSAPMTVGSIEEPARSSLASGDEGTEPKPEDEVPVDDANATSDATATPELAEAEPITPVELPSVRSSVDAGDLQPLVDLALADLSARLALDPGQISLVAAERVVWPDGGLGCPQPGMAYTQVQVDGTYLELFANGVAYPYHSGGSRGPFLCDSKG